MVNGTAVERGSEHGEAAQALRTLCPDLVLDVDRHQRISRTAALSPRGQALPLARLRGRRWFEALAAQVPYDGGDGPALPEGPLFCFEGAVAETGTPVPLFVVAVPHADGPGGVMYAFDSQVSGLSLGQAAWAARQIREQMILVEAERRLRQEAEVLLACVRAILEAQGLQQVCSRIMGEFSKVIPYSLGMVLQRQANGELAVTAASADEHLGLALRQTGDLLAEHESVARLAELSGILQPGRADGRRAPASLAFDRPALVTRLQIERETAFFVLVAGSAGGFPDRAEILMQRLALFARYAFESEQRRRTLASLAKFASMGELMSVIAHEVNQPLTVISMAAENARLALGRLETDQDLGDLTQRLRRIQQNVDKVGQIVNSIRRLAHPGQDRRGQPRARLSQVLQGVQEFMHGSLARSDVRLEVRLDGADHDIAGHPVSLQQVLINLVSNGRDAVVQARHDGRLSDIGWVAIEARAEPSERVARIRVRDNGGGIPDELKQRVFDRFFTLKEAGKGSGLGLSIVLELLGEMHGLIEVENDDCGAVFTIELPLAADLEGDADGSRAGPRRREDRLGEAQP